MGLLQEIENARKAHVAEAIRTSLIAQGGDMIAVAAATIAAADRFPAEGYPLNTDLNDPPPGLTQHARRAINEIDAGVFNGDTFSQTRTHLFLAAHVQRWSKALRLRREGGR